MTHYEHHRQNGSPVLRKLTTRPRIERMTSRTPRTKYTPGQMGLGTNVVAQTLAGRFHAQVWAEGPTGYAGRAWWVVDANGEAWLLGERDLTIVGDALVQGELFGESA